ncbi:MAG: DUF2029 domain-containing protein [Anaerolineae bacterium]|nr:DUF2029 domain-containing protein [Anaerolineae bacterium]
MSLLIPLLIAVYPGVIVTGVFWGQTDALWTLFVALALIAIERERPGWAWVCFALGVLTKFQAVYVFPLLLVLTVRRCGLRATITSLALGGLVSVALLLPFMLNSGIERVLRPFTVAVDFFPSTTVWALNLWYAVIPSNWGAHPALVYENIPDTLLLGPLSYKQIGLLLLALYALLIIVAAWRRGDERRAFVWAAALGFGFFMLPTQMHERYLFPAALLLLLGAAQDWRLWLPALLTIFTYSYNVIVPTHAPFEWLGVNLLFTFGDVTLRTALLNLLIFAAVTWVAFTDAPESPPHLYWKGLRLRIRTALAAGGVLTAALLIAITLPVLLPPTLPAEARPVNALFDDSLRLKGYALAQDGQTWHLTLYWQAQRFNNRDLTVFVHAVRGGQTIAQRDEKPLNGVYPTWRWFRNRLVVTHYTLALPEGTPPDSLYAGLYDASSAALVQDGQAVADGRALLCGGSAPCS